MARMRPRMSGRREGLRRLFVFLGWTILAVILGGSLFFYLFLRGMQEESDRMVGSGVLPEAYHGAIRPPGVYEFRPRTNILLLGVDDRGGVRGRSDAMLLLNFDHQRNWVTVLSIPRDTRVFIPGRDRYDRVNVAYALGGPNLAVQTVERLLGVPVHNYVVTNFDGFAKIIDTLGGVEIHVDQPMYYDDYAGGLHIRLDPGLQRLNGEQALGYLRFRSDGWGDVTSLGGGRYAGRVDRQQRFVQAVVREVIRPETILKIPQLVSQVQGAVRTDMTPTQMLQMAYALTDVARDRYRSRVLPGSGQLLGGASYWIADHNALSRLVWEELADGRRGILVEVLGGSGRTGHAAQVANAMQEAGVRVTKAGETQEFTYEYTSFVAKKELEPAVRWLASEVLKLERYHWVQPQQSQTADILVILGEDLL